MIWQKVNQYKKWIILLVVVVSLGGGSAFYFNKGSTPVVTGSTVTIGRGDVIEAVSATGTISAVNSVDVSSRVTGLISEVRVKENDMVKKGDVLVVLDDTTIKAQISQYQAQMANYAAIYERSQKLAAIGAEPLQQLDTDRTNYLVAQSTYNSNASQLGYYIITAPIDGMVIGTPTPAGQTVAQGISTPQVIMTIADMSKMQIKVLVDESDIGRVLTGQEVSFTVDSYATQTFTGKVTRISRSATTSSNVVYYPVYVDVESAQSLLYPTMTARVTIKVGESKNVLVAPLAAVKEEKGQKYVQLMVNGKAQNAPVSVGLSDEEKVEIRSGLNEGDSIILPATKARTATTTQNQGPPPPI
ncbi:MAG: efflux transporter, family, subunit [Pelosinus sp.]|jgi:HlyD family secretion protein|nr:efflux transporter, family, subunit [Pelosinus sp.]